MNELTLSEMKEVKGGEITLAAVMAMLAIGLMAVVCYKLFTGKSGKTTLPGGFTFTWNA